MLSVLPLTFCCSSKFTALQMLLTRLSQRSVLKYSLRCARLSSVDWHYHGVIKSLSSVCSVNQIDSRTWLYKYKQRWQRTDERSSVAIFSFDVECGFVTGEAIFVYNRVVNHSCTQVCRHQNSFIVKRIDLQTHVSLHRINRYVLRW